MSEAEDIKYMRRCIELAGKGEGLTYPNPMVGSVVVHKGLIIGEGYHIRAGESHAEVIAVNSVTDKEKLKESTLYVTLEPCSHFGKTPPCADLIIEKKIPAVVIGTADSNSLVSGKGISRLRDAGCAVRTGVLEEECRRLNRRFLTYHEKKRPYITLKWAQSADGYLDVVRRPYMKAEPNWITGKPERSLVHKWRSEEQAILVGGETVRTDNPLLNVRDWCGRDPLRIILSGSGRLDKNASVFTAGEKKALLFTHDPPTDIPGADISILNNNQPASVQIAQYLFKNGIQSLFVEGGAIVLNDFITNGLWDEARIFTGENIFERGVKAPELSGRVLTKVNFSRSRLGIILNKSTS